MTMLTALLVVFGAAAISGYLITDENSLLYPIFNPVRARLSKRIRTNHRPGFMWEEFFAQKLVCRFCSGGEASLLAAVLVHDSGGWSSMVALWLAGNVVHLTYLEILEALETEH